MESNLKSISKFARDLKEKCYNYENISGNKLYQILRDKNIIYYDENKRNTPRQEFINTGYFTMKEIKTKDKEGVLGTTESIFITEKGQEHLLGWLINNKYIELT